MLIHVRPSINVALYSNYAFKKAHTAAINIGMPLIYSGTAHTSMFPYYPLWTDHLAKCTNYL